MGLFSRSKTTSKASIRTSNSTAPSITSTNSSYIAPNFHNNSRGGNPRDMPSPTTPTTPNSAAKFSRTSPKSLEDSGVVMPKTPDPKIDPAGYLKSIGSVRERCLLILDKAKTNQLNHFTVDMDKFDDTVKLVISIIKRDFAPDYASIPPHGRWQHFNVGGVNRVKHLLNSFHNSEERDMMEDTRRLLDLFLVSVLLDAGAGNEWKYTLQNNSGNIQTSTSHRPTLSPTGTGFESRPTTSTRPQVFERSEGLAIASLEMFKSGMFSSHSTNPYQVDADGLRNLTVERLREGLQDREGNRLAGLEGRAGLLIRLADALDNVEIFGADKRPGNMLDYLLAHPLTVQRGNPMVPLPTLWSVLVDGLAPVWPSTRTTIDSTSLGDAWPLSSMPATSNPNSLPWESIVPFHKLTQWLCYSLMQPMAALLSIQFPGSSLMTGLPEYRNGGLLIDTGLLTLKDADMARGLATFKSEAKEAGKKGVEVVPMFRADDDVIVEWRAVTVGFLDEMLVGVNRGLGLERGEGISLAQMLEAGSWKGGREMAEISRPNTKSPPIAILSDGTVF